MNAAATPELPLRDLNRYPGGKNAAGVYQRLISLMPPHRVYVEAFAGSGALIRRKRRASANFAIERDPRQAARLSLPGVHVVNGDARDWLAARCWNGDELIYADPPYLMSARSWQRPLYRCELGTDQEHAELIALLRSLRAMVMISGYRSGLYDAALSDWNRVDYQAQTRRGMVTESVWFNFPLPVRLHDYSYLGEDFHDRLRIQRKINRLRAKLAALPPLERAAVIDGISDERRSASPVSTLPL